MKNKQYSKEFRDETVQLILNSGKRVCQIAKDLDVNNKTIYNWLREYKKANNIDTAINDNKSYSKLTQQELLNEIKQLKKENSILKQEREILKKATAYFAKQTL